MTSINFLMLSFLIDTRLILRYMFDKIEIKNSWVFSPKLDALAFIAPFFVAIFFINAKYDRVEDYWLSYFLAKIFIGGGHIFATYVPMATGLKFIKSLEYKVIMFPLIFVSIYFIFNFYSAEAFKNLLALTGLLHIYLQLFAWFKMHNTSSQTFKKGEKTFFLALLIIPNFLWLLNQLNNPPSYLYAISIFHNIPTLLHLSPNHLIALTFLLIVGSIYFSVSHVNNKMTLNLGKFMMLFSTVIWFCAGLFFVKSLGFFHVYLALSHGASYMIYISEGWPKHKAIGQWKSNYKYFVVAIVAMLLGYAWVISSKALKDLPSHLIFIPWLPLIIHYSFDSLIWRRTSK